jgi:hypothetical protein
VADGLGYSGTPVLEQPGGMTGLMRGLDEQLTALLAP